MRLSVVVLTKNEENNIERCLKSLDFCDEIVVVDDFSTDKTLEKIPKKSKIKIFKSHLNDDFAGQRNFGMEKAKGEWILFVDADEEISEELKKEIKEIFDIRYSILRNSKTNIQYPISNIGAFYLKRRDFWWGRELKFGEIKKVRNFGLIRLVKKGSGKWVGKVHEKFQISNFKFQIKSLKSYINHYPHPTIKEFLQEINYYSTLRAKELFETGKKTNIFELIFYPLAKFILNYFIYLGFLDGPAGFAYAFLMSFHSFLVRAKLYQLQSQTI